MQTKRYITIATIWMVFVFSLGNVCMGQSYWKRTYGDSGSVKYFYTILPTADDNYLLAGSIASGGAESDGWLLKIKPNGDTIWTKTFGSFNEDNLQTICPTNDGNFLIGGITSSFGAGNYDGWLLKVNPNGDTLWTKAFGGPELDELQAIVPTSDDNLFLVGTTSSFTENVHRSGGWLIKINQNGDLLWSKTYGGSTDYQFDGLATILPTSNGNYLLAGSTDSYNTIDSGNNAGWLIKTDSNGDTLWSKSYRGSRDHVDNRIKTILPLPDSNFLLAGYTYNYTIQGNDTGWLIKIKPNGDTLWIKTFNGKINFDPTILSTIDGNVIIGGVYWDKIYLIKIKPNGDTLWSKTYNGFYYELYSKIIQTTDGNLLLLGVSKSTGFHTFSWLFKIIADQYAYKDSLFTYKIPVYSTDTLDFGYVPLKVPFGMTVSAGGTVSWTPKTDSVYMDHAEFLVINDSGKKDTLTFNIFVNSDYHPSVTVKPIQAKKTDSKPFGINATALSGKVKLSAPSFVKSINIYDMSGRMVGKVAPVVSGSQACAVWPGASSSSSAIPTGRYFAKASAGKNTAVKPFLLVR